jgi:hypothetical protein
LLIQVDGEERCSIQACFAKSTAQFKPVPRRALLIQAATKSTAHSSGDEEHCSFKSMAKSTAQFKPKSVIRRSGADARGTGTTSSVVSARTTMSTASVAGSGGRLSRPGGAKLLLQLSNARTEGGISGQKASILLKKSTLAEISTLMVQGDHHLLTHPFVVERAYLKRGSHTRSIVSKALSFFGRLTNGLVRRKRR